MKSASHRPCSVQSAQRRTAEEPAFSPARFWTGTVLVCTAIISLSVWISHSLKRKFQRPTTPPVLSHVTTELEATERNGRTVRMSSLTGKVTVMAHVYTVCPHGCMAVLGEMSKLRSEFGVRGDFHLVSVAVIPSHDTPEFLRSFVQGMGVPDDAPWWFVTGEQESLWRFMTEGLGLNKPEPIPEPERLNPLDLYAHDLRLVLLDRRQRVRGYYDVAHPQAEIASLMRERLHRDTQFLLDHPEL